MNPLENLTDLPNFADIKPEHVDPVLEKLLETNKTKISELLKQSDYTWENFVEPIELLDEKLSVLWDVVSHLHAVKMDVWRDAYQKNLPKLIDYHTELSQSEELFKAYEKISLSPAYIKYSPAKKKVIKNILRDFKLSGVHLSEKEKKYYAELQQELGQLTTQVEQNVVDATYAWNYHIEKESDLAGLPEHTIKLARENAQEQGKSGWILTLDFPCYFSVMSYADDRNLREVFYEAYVTRASDQGPLANQYDNGPVIKEILLKRQLLAEVLGFENYASLSLATKMLQKTEEVFSFLNNLVKVAHKKAQKDWDELANYAKQKHAVDALQAWDVAYYREKLQHEKFNITEEALRPYFPLNKVIQGLFTVVNRLYGVSIRQETATVWHPDVKFYSVYDATGNKLGSFYFDLHTRPEKQQGAWAADGKRRLHTPSYSQQPVAYLNCNFEPPLDGKAFLTHEQVVTLFHEFGHGLHHLLTVIDHPSVAGTHGVPWDVVEVPSQLMENWCWEKEGLALIADNLPDELFERMHAAKNFCSGMDVLRQLEFSLFDFELHAHYQKDNPPDPNAFFQTLKAKMSVVPTPAYNRFANGFTHIFAGGYAAGYYSYLWAEVMSDDIFSKFKREGIFNKNVATRYLELILSQGGVCDPFGAFVDFMGRPPELEAFLQHRGLLKVES